MVDLITRGELDAVLCCGFLSARSTWVAIIYTISSASHTLHTQHLHGHNNIKIFVGKQRQKPGTDDGDTQNKNTRQNNYLENFKSGYQDNLATERRTSKSM